MGTNYDNSRAIWWFNNVAMKVDSMYPLVNIQQTMENHHAIDG